MTKSKIDKKYKLKFAVDAANVSDKRVRNLVYCLNLLPEIETFSSCGGHKGKRNPSQVPFGHFSVNFGMLEFNASAMSSLAIIVQECSMWKNYEVKIWFNDDEWSSQPDPDLLCFEIRGKGNPNDLAKSIIAYC